MRTIDVDGVEIGPERRPYVVVDAGTNFMGDVTLGKAFVEAAAAAGADAVKFQTHVQRAEMSESGMRALGYGDLFDRLRQQELTEDEHRELQAHCEKHGVTFLSTPFSTEAVALLGDLDVPAFKIGSGELTNHHLLDAACEHGKPLLISTGMSDMAEIRDAVEFVRNRTEEFALFYCVSAYPTDTADLDLGLVEELKREFDVPVGFSDHSRGVQAAAVAMARGADIVEKHFTIDRRLPGGDQDVSIEPEELSELTEYADLVHETRGTDKQLLGEERSIKEWANHSLVTTADLEAGDVLTEETVTTKRPGTGIPADRYFDVLGAEVVEDLQADAVISPSDIDQ